MQWKYYFKNVVSHYKVVIEDWPSEVPFANLSNVSSPLAELETMLRKWEMGQIHWKRITEDEYKQLCEERRSQVERGELTEPTRRPRQKRVRNDQTDNSARPNKKHKSAAILPDDIDTNDEQPPVASTGTNAVTVPTSIASTSTSTDAATASANTTPTSASTHGATASANTTPTSASTHEATASANTTPGSASTHEAAASANTTPTSASTHEATASTNTTPTSTSTDAATSTASAVMGADMATASASMVYVNPGGQTLSKTSRLLFKACQRQI